MSYYLFYEEELDEAYEEGYEDYLNGFHYDENPFMDEDLAFEWEEGWLDARYIAHYYKYTCSY